MDGVAALTAAVEPFRPWAPPLRPQPPGFVESLWLLYRNPLLIWSEAHFEQPILFGENRFRRVVSVQDPAGVKHVLVDNAANYTKGPIQRRVLGPLLGEGLLTSEGADWRKARRTLAPLFTPRATAALGSRMADAVERCAERWRALPDGTVVNVETEMSRLTFDILSDTLFSGDLGGDAEGFERALTRALKTAGRVDPLDMISAPDWVPRLSRLGGRSAGRFFRRRVRELAEARRAQLADQGSAPPQDLLTALLRAQDPETGVGLTTAEVEANVLTFILAGHETTARALGWTFHLLAHAPSVLARVRAEADRPLPDDPCAWADAAPWTRASLEEAMRLFPPAPGFTREAIGHDEVLGVPVRPGTVVLITPWVIHRHRRLWAEPEAFRPERFLPGAREAIDRHAYLPFGAGPRVCIGARFAMQEAVVALHRLAGAFQLTALEGLAPRPMHQVTLRAERPLRMVLTHR